MFEGLSQRLSGILDALTRRGALTEDDVNAAMREVRRALIEADVSLDVVKSFTDKVKNRAIGAEVVHDHLVELVHVVGHRRTPSSQLRAR